MNPKKFFMIILALSLLVLGAKGGFPKSAKGKGDYVEGDPTGFVKLKYSFSSKESVDGIISGFATEKYSQVDPQTFKDEYIIYD